MAPKLRQHHASVLVQTIHLMQYGFFFRLDRLFILLDSGSTQVVRKAAADEIGKILLQHPEELQTLLSKVIPAIIRYCNTRIVFTRKCYR